MSIARERASASVWRVRSARSKHPSWTSFEPIVGLLRAWQSLPASCRRSNLATSRLCATLSARYGAAATTATQTRYPPVGPLFRRRAASTAQNQLVATAAAKAPATVKRMSGASWLSVQELDDADRRDAESEPPRKASGAGDNEREVRAGPPAVDSPGPPPENKPQHRGEVEDECSSDQGNDDRVIKVAKDRPYRVPQQKPRKLFSLPRM